MDPVKHEIHAFTIKYNGTMLRITTKVGISAAFDPQQHPLKPPTPILENVALWDTGATNSVITQATAKSLGLVAVGVTSVSHAGGSSQSPTYLVNFFLPNAVMIPGVQVSECPDNSAFGFGAIIGMDIISAGDLSITNVEHQTWMSFRIPSVQTIDYVVEANRLKYAGVPRNAPCPCGSGKKFKVCHGQVSAH